MQKHHHKGATPAPSAQTAPTTQPAVASGNKGQKAQSVAAEAIRISAYGKWERAGKPTGDGVQFWLEAEQELLQGK